jgi:hypothetical protein
VSHESLGESSVSRGLFDPWSDPGEYENAETMLRAWAARVSHSKVKGQSRATGQSKAKGIEGGV